MYPDEYPKFVSKNDGDESLIEIASLLLLRTSEESTFHKPMCAKLLHETQVKIKMFLETALPLGKNITREHLSYAISELGSENLFELPHPRTPHQTPKGRPLTDFFNSPVAQSAQSHRLLSEKNRELQKLVSDLALERCEKEDLIEDVKMYQERVEKLQKKLQDKEQELKALRAEMMKPATPQSSKKTDKTTVDLYRYIILNFNTLGFATYYFFKFQIYYRSYFK